MMFVSFDSNLIGVNSGAGTSNPSGAPEFNPHFLMGFALFNL